MKARDILNNTDPSELRNILYRLNREQIAIQTPPLSEVVEQLPEAYPPTTTSVLDNTGWFNVKDYGAIGDGAADDTAAINDTIIALNTAGRGVLYFPAGDYLVSSGLTDITADCIVMGDSEAGSLAVGDLYVSRISFTSATENLFDVSSSPFHVTFKDLALKNTNSTPTSGVAVQVSGTIGPPTVVCNFYRVSVQGFYAGINIDAMTELLMDQCRFAGNLLFGVQCSYGRFSITNSYFDGFHGAWGTVGIAVSDGGGNIGSVINGNTILYFESGISFNMTSPVKHCIVSNNNIRASYGKGIFVSGSSDPLEQLQGLVVNGNSITMVDSDDLLTTGEAIRVANCQDTVISNNVLIGNDFGIDAIILDTVDGARIFGNMPDGWGDLVSQIDCTDIVIFAGDIGVSFIAKSGSTALTGDVTLSAGTNVTLTQVGQDIQIAASLSSVLAKLVMETGVTFPPVPLTNAEGTDWIYETT